MAYANGGDSCWSTLDNYADHEHHCVFAAEHTDWDHDGSHQCECGQIW